MQELQNELTMKNPLPYKRTNWPYCEADLAMKASSNRPGDITHNEWVCKLGSRILVESNSC